MIRNTLSFARVERRISAHVSARSPAEGQMLVGGGGGTSLRFCVCTEAAGTSLVMFITGTLIFLCGMRKPSRWPLAALGFCTISPVLAALVASLTFFLPSVYMTYVS